MSRADFTMMIQAQHQGNRCRAPFSIGTVKPIPFFNKETFPFCSLLDASNCYTWWRHQMETFSALLAICAGIHQSPVNSPHKGQWRGALMFSLICVWINGWVNNREAGELRCYRVHCDITVMTNQFVNAQCCQLHSQFSTEVFWIMASDMNETK